MPRAQLEAELAANLGPEKRTLAERDPHVLSTNIKSFCVDV